MNKDSIETAYFKKKKILTSLLTLSQLKPGQTPFLLTLYNEIKAMKSFHAVLHDRCGIHLTAPVNLLQLVNNSKIWMFGAK